MELLGQSLRSFALVVISCVLVATACTSPSSDDDADDELDVTALSDPPRRYTAEWLIDASSVGRDDITSPFIYREVADDQTGMYLIESPNHLALQRPDEVVLCAAVSRLPLDPYCAASPRAEGAPHVLSYPIQLLSEWGPRGFYDLASYREVSLVAASDPDNWSRLTTTAGGDLPVECFLVTGQTSAADTGFEICYTNDDLHLVASVDLQNDLVFEIELLRYERGDVLDEFETGLDVFIEARPALQEQLLDLYPEIPAARPTPTPDPEAETEAG